MLVWGVLVEVVVVVELLLLQLGWLWSLAKWYLSLFYTSPDRTGYLKRKERTENLISSLA